MIYFTYSIVRRDDIKCITFYILCITLCISKYFFLYLCCTRDSLLRKQDSILDLYVLLNLVQLQHEQIERHPVLRKIIKWS